MDHAFACAGKRHRPRHGRGDCRTGYGWKVGIRNGDTSLSERAQQKRQAPEILIITPESLHLLLAQKHYPEYF